ncbi:hypothetical protein [Singulisphaera sp. GP187]|uniref:hypothetical protein n=1 Tax=Singulisphaera sp. GP187 TaxID=1882752 RepID=UPI00094180E7|nr:hypothetical protein [Singulisphaera sp. GP187]
MFAPVPRHFPFLWFVAGIVVVAIVLGRSTEVSGPDRSPRYPAHPRYLGIRASWFSDHPDTPRLLDTETGLISLDSANGEQGFEDLSCSPWRDGDGRYHMAGRWRDFDSDRSGGLTRAFGLARSTFPASSSVERVDLEIPIWGRPCWSPDRSDRVLFTGGDGRLLPRRLLDNPEVGARAATGGALANRSAGGGRELATGSVLVERAGTGWTAPRLTAPPIGPVSAGTRPPPLVAAIEPRWRIDHRGRARDRPERRGTDLALG